MLKSGILAAVVFFVSAMLLIALLGASSALGIAKETNSLANQFIDQVGPERIEAAGLKGTDFLDREIEYAQRGSGRYRCDADELRSKVQDVDMGELDFDQVCESMMEINKHASRMQILPGLVMGFSFLLGASPFIWRYRKKKKLESAQASYAQAVDATEERNKLVVDEWEESFKV